LPDLPHRRSSAVQNHHLRFIGSQLQFTSFFHHLLIFGGRILLFFAVFLY